MDLSFLVPFPFLVTFPRYSLSLSLKREEGGREGPVRTLTLVAALGLSVFVPEVQRTVVRKEILNEPTLSVRELQLTRMKKSVLPSESA